MSRAVCAAAVLLAMAGCSSVDGQRSSNVIVPGRTLNVSPSLTISAEAIVAGALLFTIIDPLAPNWSTSALRLDSSQRFEITMRMKRFTTGGEGEAPGVFRRTADRIAREGGYGGYDILDYAEGIESTVPVAQRVARGVIQLR